MPEWLSIFLASLLFEDPTTILMATRAHDGHLTWIAGSLALFIGVVIGDTAVYVLGYLARVGLIRRDLSHLSHPVTGWYLFAARFAPGLRVVVYTTSGFFKYPLLRFLLINALSCIVWSVLLIVIGEQIYKYTGWWGVGGVIAAFVLWQVVKRLMAARTKKRDGTVEP